MTNPKYILVDQNALVAIVNSLCKIDEVKGYDNMDILVGCVAALKSVINGSPAVNIKEEAPARTEDKEILDAANAAKEEELARSKK